MVVRFYKGVGQMIAIVELLQPIFLSCCGERKDCGGTTNVVLGGG